MKDKPKEKVYSLFPQPVSPVTSTTRPELQASFNLDKKLSRAFHAGSDFRCLSITFGEQNGIAGVVPFGGIDQKGLLILGLFLIDVTFVLLGLFVDGAEGLGSFCTVPAEALS